MNYRAKSFLQNAIDPLPSPLAYEVYYKVQRAMGGLKTINPSSKLAAGRKVLEIAAKAGFAIKGKRVVEIGSGRSPILPLSLWLHGANRIVTSDLNPYFKEEVWMQEIRWLTDQKASIEELFPDINRERLRHVTTVSSFKKIGASLAELHNMGIDYLAPADARALPYDNDYFDAHISHNTLEHIPQNSIKEIFKEAKRVVTNNGIMIHNIDYSDHFSHSDKSISAINFLRFSKEDFQRLAGNRFMYMNRLRDDDFRQIWHELEMQPFTEDKIISEEVLKTLSTRKGNFIHQDFSKKTLQDLATLESWYGFHCISS